MFGIGFPELILIFIVALIVLGPQKLPEIAKALGRAYAEFSRSMREVQSSISEITSEFEQEAKVIRDPVKATGEIIEKAFTEPADKIKPKDTSGQH